MNYLANIYLAREFNERMIGNFIGEVVKPSAYYKYPPSIMEGIALNKSINEFVKSHPVFQRSLKRLNPKYGKYSCKIVNIFYDHFLASLWEEYNTIALEDFTKSAYFCIIENFSFMPAKLTRLIPLMISENWLLNFSSLDGIHRYMLEITKRDTFRSSMQYSLEDLIQNYGAFKEDFKEIFPEIIEFAGRQQKGASFVPNTFTPYLTKAV